MAPSRMAIEFKTEYTQLSDDFAVAESGKTAQMRSRGYDDGVVLPGGKGWYEAGALAFAAGFNRLFRDVTRDFQSFGNGSSLCDKTRQTPSGSCPSIMTESGIPGSPPARVGPKVMSPR